MEREPAAISAPRWAWIAAIWGGIGLFDATKTVVVMRAAGMHHAWVALFALTVLAWLPWALATPLVMRTAARQALGTAGGGLAAALARHAGTWLAVALAAASWLAALTWLLNPWTPDRPSLPLARLFADTVYEQFLASLILYACIVMAGIVLDSRERLARQRADAARLAEELARAQLDALRHQVEPHFLFNALNAIAGLVREARNDEAVETIARVSDFLRHLLHESGRQEVPLDEELRFASLYLAIQQVRFADRMRVDIDIAPGLGAAVVPRLILQPIVENAVKHGIAQRAQAGRIEIAAARHGDELRLTVYNDGPALPATAKAGPAIGLANVSRRLLGLHGARASLTMRDVEARGVLVSIALPWRLA